MYRSTLILSLMVLVSFVGLVQADFPKLINYQGMLTDDSGTPLNGSYDLIFRIYDDTTGAGTQQWTETQNGVQVDHGLFNVILGRSTGLNLAFDESYWLEVQVGAEVMPRIRFTSVGYAYRARTADTASVAVATPAAGGWTDDGSVVRLTNSTDMVGIGTSTPGAELEVFSSDQVNLWLNRGGMAWAASLNFRRGGVLDWTMLTPSGDTSLLILNQSHQTVQSFLQNGNVGIGKDGPSSKLDVDGDINASGSYKIFGSKVLSTGNQNLFVGLSAGYSNTTGGSNTIVGTNAGDNNTTGSYNIFVGNYAGRFNTSGDGNIAIGQYASYWDSSGSFNTILGYQAGHNNDTGSCNVFIGNHAGYSETGSNKLYIANGDVDPPLVYGDFSTGNIGLGTTDPSRKLHIVGTNPRILIEASSGSPEVNFTNSDDSGTETWALYKHGTADDLRFYQSGDKVTLQNGTGNVGIGTTNPNYKLDVNGDINVSGSYNVNKGGVPYQHPDYVFDPDYQLMSLSELKDYVREKKSLPNVITAEEVKKNQGFKMDDLLIQMLEKIEEQTLYIFQLEERIAQLEKNQQKQ
jgi:hypothetical protein